MKTYIPRIPTFGEDCPKPMMELLNGEPCWFRHLRWKQMLAISRRYLKKGRNA